MNTQKQIFLIVVLLFAFVGSCAGYAVLDLPFRAPNQEDYSTEESITRGALLFANNCRTCHGNQGEGGIGVQLNRPDLQDLDPIKLKANRDMLRRTITCGRAATLMPAWLHTNGGSINERQIEHIVGFLTAPIDPALIDANGNQSNKGWTEALEFAENLNREMTALVGGDTLDAIARIHGIGPRELAAFNGLPADDAALDAPLPKNKKVKIPPTPQFPDGRAVTVYTSNETIRKLAENQHVGAAMIAEANDLEFTIDVKRGQFRLLDPDGQPRFGLFPGDKLALPAGATYLTVAVDTLETVAAAHSIDVATLKDLNRDKVGTLAPGEPLPADLVLALPEINAYPVKGQTLEDIANVYSNVTPDSLAEANGVAPDALLQIGQPLQLPADTWGTAPGIGTKNPGTACVQYAVPAVVFDTIMGIAPATGEKPEVPATASTDARIDAHATDWTITSGGQAQPINKGAVLVSRGTAIPITSVSGLHTITLNGKNDAGGDLKQGATRTITFGEAGDFKLTCTYHPDMLAWIFVK